MEYLSKEEISRIHDTIIKETGGLGGVLDGHALLMLEGQPAQYVFGKELYPGIFEKAAFYARAINGGHIFIDGNKRTSIAVINKFLKKNGYLFEPSEQEKELEEVSINIAKNILNLKQIACWIEKNSKKKDFS